MSLQELADKIGHEFICVALAHESLQEAGYPDWDDALNRVEEALHDHDCTCWCKK